MLKSSRRNKAEGTLDKVAGWVLEMVVQGDRQEDDEGQGQGRPRPGPRPVHEGPREEPRRTLTR